MGRSEGGSTSRAVGWESRIASMPVAVKVPVMASAQSCQLNLIPFARDQLFLGLAAAGIDFCDVFLLLAAITVWVLLDVREDSLVRYRSPVFLEQAGGPRSRIGSDVTGYTFVSWDILDADCAGAGG